MNDESRVERRKRQTRERIFQTALDLFIEKGMDDTTVAEIAEAADIGKGTFFTYFPTKESVFSEVSRQLVDAMERSLAAAAAAGASIEGRLAALFQPAIDWHGSNPVLSRYMLAAAMRDTAYIKADQPTLSRLHELMARQLAGARAAGAITADVDLAAATGAVACAYFGSLGAWHGAETRVPLAAVFSGSLQVVLRGLRP